MNRRIHLACYLIGMLALAVAVCLPWMGWNHNFLMFYGYEPLYGKILVIIAILAGMIALAGPAVAFADGSPGGILSRGLMTGFGIAGLVLCFLILEAGTHRVSAVGVPHSILSGVYAGFIGAALGTLFGAITDWAGAAGPTGEYETDEDAEAIETTPIIPLKHTEPTFTYPGLPPTGAMGAMSGTVMPTTGTGFGMQTTTMPNAAMALASANNGGGVALAESPAVEVASSATGARRRAELRVQQELQLLEMAYRNGEISDIEYATRKLSFASKVEEYELMMMVEAKTSSLRGALAAGKINEAGYESKMRALRNAIRRAVGSAGA